MVKALKGKDDAPYPNSVPNREIFQRLNFLYQASAYLIGLGHGHHTSTSTTPEKQVEIAGASGARKEEQKKRKRVATVRDLSSSYIHSMRIIGRKAVVRMDPSVKRTLCTGCDTVLLPGTTASVRVKGSSRRGRKMVYTCLSCHTSRAIPAPSTPSPAPPAPAATLPPIDTPVPTTPSVLDAPSTRPTSQPSHRRKKRKMKPAHSLPLFARLDAGHVIFRGNEVIDAMQ